MNELLNPKKNKPDAADQLGTAACIIVNSYYGQAVTVDMHLEEGDEVQPATAPACLLGHEITAATGSHSALTAWVASARAHVQQKLAERVVVAALPARACRPSGKPSKQIIHALQQLPESVSDPEFWMVHAGEATRSFSGKSKIASGLSNLAGIKGDDLVAWVADNLVEVSGIMIRFRHQVGKVASALGRKGRWQTADIQRLTRTTWQKGLAADPAAEASADFIAEITQFLNANSITISGGFPHASGTAADRGVLLSEWNREGTGAAIAHLIGSGTAADSAAGRILMALANGTFIDDDGIIVGISDPDPLVHEEASWHDTVPQTYSKARKERAIAEAMGRVKYEMAGPVASIIRDLERFNGRIPTALEIREALVRVWKPEFAKALLSAAAGDNAGEIFSPIRDSLFSLMKVDRELFDPCTLKETMHTWVREVSEFLLAHREETQFVERLLEDNRQLPTSTVLSRCSGVIDLNIRDSVEIGPAIIYYRQLVSASLALQQTATEAAPLPGGVAQIEG